MSTQGESNVASFFACTYVVFEKHWGRSALVAQSVSAFGC